MSARLFNSAAPNATINAMPYWNKEKDILRLLIRFWFLIRTKFLASFDHVLNGWRSKNVPKLRPAKTADEEK